MKTSQKRSTAASLAPSRRSTTPNVSPGRGLRAAAARSDERDAQPVAQRQVPVARAAPAGVGLMSRARAVLGEHRQREPRAQIRAALADAVEEAEVLGEAAERDVLAVVGRRLRIALALRQRLHRAAERRPRLVQRHVDACVDEVERRGRPASPPPTTATFIASRFRARRRASFARRREPARRVEDVEAVRLHAVELAAVEAGERRRRRARCAGRASRAGAALRRDARARAAPGTPSAPATPA